MLSSWHNALLVFLGGGMGACSRWLLDRWVASLLKTGVWPMGTFVVNMLGCALIGVLFGVLSRSKGDPAWVWMLGAVGFLGAFTTFSSFCLQLFEQYMERQWGVALAYILASVACGFLLVLAGYSLAKH